MKNSKIFNQNWELKLEEFNQNWELKLEEFNQNWELKDRNSKYLIKIEN